MERTTQKRHAAARALGLGVLTLALAACGGGGSSDGSAADAAAAEANAAALSASTLTVAQYQSQRSGGAAGTTGTATAPTATQQASLRSADQALAVAQWQSDFTGANPVVLPPLTYASARALAAAAQGDTLAQINTALAGRIDLAPDAAAAAWQTGRVASAGWAATGFKLARSFLNTIDSHDGRLTGWSLAEAGFAEGTAASDAGLTQALAASGLYPPTYSTQTNLRLLLTHTLKLAPTWAAGSVFDGFFENDNPRGPLSLKLLRLTNGVKRLAGSDYTADMLAAGDLRVLSLRPTTGTLATFNSTRLAPALAEAVQALVVDGGGSAGELLLPFGPLPLDAAVDAPITRAGVTLAFDEVNANLRGLDETGGTYAQVSTPTARLVINADGLTLDTAHVAGFAFSARNVNGGGSVVTVGAGSDDLIFLCERPAADLRTFYLALLDARGALLALAAVQQPDALPLPCPR